MGSENFAATDFVETKISWSFPFSFFKDWLRYEIDIHSSFVFEKVHLAILGEHKVANLRTTKSHPNLP